MMRKFYQNKLWRSKLIEQKQAKGGIIETHHLAHAEMKEELNFKLLEEANEIATAEDHFRMMSEIADVLEVIDCIIDFHGLSKDEILKLKDLKKKEFGSYTDPRLVDYVQYPAGSEEEKHCLNNPDEYPEMEDEEDEEIIEIVSCCKK